MMPEIPQHAKMRAFHGGYPDADGPLSEADDLRLRLRIAEARERHLVESMSRMVAMAISPMVIVQKSDGLWQPARPLRASWEWQLRFSDWLEDVLIPRLRRKR